MNILVFTSEYPQPDDFNKSTTKVVHYFTKEWVKQGNRVLVIHNSSKFPVPFYFIPQKLKNIISTVIGTDVPSYSTRKKIVRIEDGVQIIRLPINKTLPGRNCSSGVILNHTKKINTLLNDMKFKPDIITGHWQYPQLPIIASLKKLYDCRTAIVFHGDYDIKNCKKHKTQRYIETIDYVGCRSKVAAYTIQNNLSFKSEPFICTSGIPDEYTDKYALKQPKEFSDSIFRIAYVGRLIKYKNIDSVIKALIIAFPKKDFIFDIVGEGVEKENLQQLCKNNNLLKQVNFHGYLSRGHVMDILHQATCFAMISNHETFGLVYLEAMLAGCIVVASKNGGVDGIIKDKVNGFLCEEGNYIELSDILKKIRYLSKLDISDLSKTAIQTALYYKDSLVAKRYLCSISATKN